jgi:hypothetical protein
VSGACQTIAAKLYIRALDFPMPHFDAALGRSRRKLSGPLRPTPCLSSSQFSQIGRYTNGLLKTLENASATVALYCLYCNFARVHQTLRVTPALEARLTDHVWGLETLVGAIGQT